MLEDYPDILTPHEAMEILGIGKNLLYTLLKKRDNSSKTCWWESMEDYKKRLDFLYFAAINLLKSKPIQKNCR